LYTKHAQEKGTPLTVRDLARQVRVAQWELFEFIDASPLLRFWTVGEGGEPIHRQGLFLVEYIPYESFSEQSPVRQ
jgi:hypothetical protein